MVEPDEIAAVPKTVRVPVAVRVAPELIATVPKTVVPAATLVAV